jgi:YesN/AraC family two-component response regulator
MIVDDDPKIRELLRRVLTAVEVTEAANGKEALLKVSQRQPDLVITDIKMPEMDGFTLLAHLRERCPELKVLAISGYIGAEIFENCGFDGFISSPSSFAEILSKVNKILGMRSP